MFYAKLCLARWILARLLGVIFSTLVRLCFARPARETYLRALYAAR
jgi:hypothetical protein